MKNVSEYICHKNNRNALKKKKCLWLGESGKIEEEGYRELFERVGTGGLFSPGKVFLEGNKENHTYCEQT